MENYLQNPDGSVMNFDPSPAGQSGTMDKLLGNNLLWQYLSAAGQALSEGKPIASALNPITQQNIGAQSKVKMQQNYLQQLAQTMRSNLPAGSNTTDKGSSFKMNPDGSMTMTIGASQVANQNSLESLMPHLLAGGLAPGQQVSNPIKEEVIQPTPQPQMQEQVPVGTTSMGKLSPQTKSPEGDSGLTLQQRQQLQQVWNTQGPDVARQMMENMLNPNYGQLNVTGADLAGLGSADVSQALHDALGVEGARQSALKDAYLMSKEQKGSVIYPVPVPNVGYVTEAQWQHMPEAVRAHAMYVNAEKQSGSKNQIMNLQEFHRWWNNQDKNTQVDYLKALQSDPSLMDTAMQLKKAGATQVNVGEKKFETEIAKQDADLLDPNMYANVEKEVSKDRATYNVPSQEFEAKAKAQGITDYEKVSKLWKHRQVINAMDRKIRSRYDNVTIGDDGWWYVDGKRFRRIPQL